MIVEKDKSFICQYVLPKNVTVIAGKIIKIAQLLILLKIALTKQD